jgi:hypothetical protein
MAAAEPKTGPQKTGLFGIRPKLPYSPAVPVTMMMVMMTIMVMVPAMPPMMMVVVVAVMSPVYFRRRQPGVLLNRRGGAGIAERQCIGALGGSSKSQQRAHRRKPQNLHNLHISLLGSSDARLRRMACIN